MAELLKTKMGGGRKALAGQIDALNETADKGEQLGRHVCATG